MLLDLEKLDLLKSENVELLTTCTILSKRKNKEGNEYFYLNIPKKISQRLDLEKNGQVMIGVFDGNAVFSKLGSGSTGVSKSTAKDRIEEITSVEEASTKTIISSSKEKNLDEMDETDLEKMQL